LSQPRVALFNRAEQQVEGASSSPWRLAMFTFSQSTTRNDDVTLLQVVALLIVHRKEERNKRSEQDNMEDGKENAKKIEQGR
jgi:hypothetical protein